MTYDAYIPSENPCPRVVGTKSSPITDCRPAELAQSIIGDLFTTSTGAPCLFEFRSDFWVWGAFGGSLRWQVFSAEEMEDLVWLWLSKAFMVTNNKDSQVISPIRYTRNLVQDVIRCMQALTRFRGPRVPWFLDAFDADPRFIIAYKDVLLDTKATAQKGSPVTYERTRSYFDSLTLPYDFDPEPKCPLWREKQQQWGGGETNWAELHDRVLAYPLISFRYAKWILLYGIARGGKSTSMDIVKELLGHVNVLSIQMRTLGAQFGLHRLPKVRSLVVNEIADQTRPIMEQASVVIKNIVGEDAIDIDRKYYDAAENVVIGAVPFLIGNKVPNMPNAGRGLSSKMVPMPFNVSFEGAEDYDLRGKLRAELGGIASSLGLAAARLVGDNGRFPLTESGKMVMEKYLRVGSPADWFLEWGFEKSGTSHVPTAAVYETFKQFCQTFNLEAMTRHEFTGWLEANNSWKVTYARKNQGGPMGFKGLAMKIDRGHEEE